MDELSDPAGLAVSKTEKTVIEMAHQEPPSESKDRYEFDPATNLGRSAHDLGDQQHPELVDTHNRTFNPSPLLGTASTKEN